MLRSPQVEENRLRHRQLPSIVAPLLVAACALALGAGHPGSDSTGTARTQAADSAHADTLAARDLIQPGDLGKLLAGPAAKRPTLLQVGFKVLFRSGHITGSRYVGPASKPEGLATLEQVLRPMPRQGPLVLYCGCCPWTDCPNVHPAFRMARAMGFKNVKVLFVAKNMQNDWIDEGLPTSEGDH